MHKEAALAYTSAYPAHYRKQTLPDRDAYNISQCTQPLTSLGQARETHQTVDNTALYDTGLCMGLERRHRVQQKMCALLLLLLLLLLPLLLLLLPLLLLSLLWLLLGLFCLLRMLLLILGLLLILRLLLLLLLLLLL